MEEKKKFKEVKRLRPWVKGTAASVVGLTAYTALRAIFYRPKPHVVQFDLRKIEEMREKGDTFKE
jgi:hypothetical protein